jgi:hypothetical protein
MRQMKFLFAGVEIGPFSEEQVSRYLQEGYLSLSDLAKVNDDAEWSLLQEILDRFAARQVRAMKPVPKPISLGSQAAAARITDKLPVFAA